MSQFLTTREVAALLRIKERKVYELVSEGTIPVSRVTGKLLFPRELIEAWVRRHAHCRDGVEGLVARPSVLAGSHDPLLEWALRASGAELATFFDGSLDGLERLAEAKAIAAGLHVREPERDDWNRAHVERRLAGMPVVLLAWARRTQGLVVPAGNPRRIEGLADLAGMPFVPRQPGSGSHLLLDHLARQAGVDAASLGLVSPPARSELEVALAVSEGRAEAGLAIEAVARQLRLGFVPLVRERYDLALWRRDYFEPPLQRLLAFCRTSAFAERAGTLGGYDVSELGEVRYNAP